MSYGNVRLCALGALQALLVAVVLSATGSPAYAQADPQNVGYAVNNPCKDPWLSIAISVARTNHYGPGRGFTSNHVDGECNTLNYNGGHWVHYSELLGYVQAYFHASPSAAQTNLGRNNPCTDPWISLAVSFFETAGGAPNAGRAVGSGTSDECNSKLYNYGSWNSYSQLLESVRATQTTMWSSNTRFQPKGAYNSTPTLVKLNPSLPITAGIILNGGGNIILNGGGNIILNGGGNIVVPGAAIVAQGAGNIVSQGAGNIGDRNLSGYTATATVVLPGGKNLYLH